MRLILLVYLTEVLYAALGLILPAPLNLKISSFNFKHRLNWQPGPGSPQGVDYMVYRSCPKSLKQVKITQKTSAKIQLQQHRDTHRLCVRSSFNKTMSPLSKIISFTPYSETNITAPNVTLFGCGTCIRMNISLPRPDKASKIQDIRDVYTNLMYKVSWKKNEHGLEFEESKLTSNQTVVIEHLLPGSEYCVQVKPMFLDLTTFKASPLKCEFTSISPPSRDKLEVVLLSLTVFWGLDSLSICAVWAVVSGVTVPMVLSLTAVALVLVALQYTGLMCNMKTFLPHILNTTLSHHSMLSLEKTATEPVCLILEAERGPSSSYSLDCSSDDEEAGQEESRAHYMDRGVDLSSGSISSGGHGTMSIQSATVVKHTGNVVESTADQEEGKACIPLEDLWKNESREKKKSEEWEKILDISENVNVFSVTSAALDFHRDTDLQQQSHIETLLSNDFQTHTSSECLVSQQQQHYNDVEEETELTNYMCH